MRASPLVRIICNRKVAHVRVRLYVASRSFTLRSPCEMVLALRKHPTLFKQKLQAIDGIM